ncbi:FkbM family methyltransferase [Mongoliitalea lutea]|uniref:Methyltransferase FkbM domain-containing protein n=1 Tax=Mongoliitalea lutea TaxID=849756 RepID=A0A8J3CYD7_9BACT|nr:FkbM family methyltransferase [Mongoliitalea lutea]GHB37294.1 hypothetical protein GCM10008106_18250 [Mongoliitalea lutea]
MNNQAKITENELFKLVMLRKVTRILPKNIGYRLAHYFYNFESPKVQGVDLVIETNQGINCLINTKDLIGWTLFFFGEYEKLTNKILLDYVKEGDVVIEAGANIGTETLLISKLVGAEGKIFAFEPSPHVFEKLTCNVKLHTIYNNVQLFDCALGEEDSTITFYVFPKKYHNSGIGGKYSNWENTIPITVPQLSLDSWAAKHQPNRIDFIKMDIQGAELDLLHGSSKLISTYRPKIFLEAQENQAKLFEFLTNKSYTVHQIADHGLVKLSSAPDYASDWLALP